MQNYIATPFRNNVFKISEYIPKNHRLAKHSKGVKLSKTEHINKHTVQKTQM